MKTTGEILKEYRNRNNLNVRDLAEKIGVSQTFITRIETNQNKVSEKVLEVLRVILPKLEYKEILEYEDYRNTPDFIRREIDELHRKELSKKRKVVSEVGEIPFFSDIRASAGVGCLNGDTNSDQYIEVPKKFAKRGNVAIRVYGDSMYPEIQDDDIVIVDTCEVEYCQNKIVIVNYKDELFVKKIRKINDLVMLESSNPYYKPIKIEGTEDFKIIGRVVHLEREYI